MVQTSFPDRAQVVVIGGGVTGCSVAYHLALAGWRDVVLVEKAQLTSGSTCHAAGLVTQFNPSPAMMRFRRYSVELYERLGVFDRLGSLRIASSPESLVELERGASRARGIGLDVHVLSPDEALERMPQASRDDLYGAIWIEQDGCVDPHTATHALADAARELGAAVLQNTRVTGIELDDRRAVRAVLTSGGRIAAEHVVNACGIWAPQVSAMVGAFTPSVPVDHQHIALQAVDGHELPRDMPCFRDTDNLVYGRSEAGGVLFGGYEPNPVSRWLDGVPWDHAGGEPAGRRAAVRPALERRGAAVSVPRGRGHGHAGVPPGRDDAGRESAAGPGAGGARVLDGGRAVAERLRRGGRDRKDDRGVDDRRRDRARRARDAGLAVRRRLPAAGPGGRGRARGLPLLLPAAVPGRPRRVGPATTG